MILLVDEKGEMEFFREQEVQRVKEMGKEGKD